MFHAKNFLAGHQRGSRFGSWRWKTKVGQSEFTFFIVRFALKAAFFKLFSKSLVITNGEKISNHSHASSSCSSCESLPSPSNSMEEVIMSGIELEILLMAAPPTPPPDRLLSGGVGVVVVDAAVDAVVVAGPLTWLRRLVNLAKKWSNNIVLFFQRDFPQPFFKLFL